MSEIRLSDSPRAFSIDVVATPDVGEHPRKSWATLDGLGQMCVFRVVERHFKYRLTRIPCHATRSNHIRLSDTQMCSATTAFLCVA